ncbi:MAG: hypothetical protein ACKOC5_16095, partial [Chloroflexota bacterium]
AILAAFAALQVLSAMLVVGLVVDMDISGTVFPDFGALEMFVTLYLAMFASITFGLFISAIVPNTDVVLYAILVQLFVQIILGGTLFPIDSKVASSATVAYWTTDALGATVDMRRLNDMSLACSGQEMFDENTGAKVNKPYCSPADTDLSLSYEHTPEFVISRWWGLIVHTLLWFTLTVIVQARKKGE